MYLGKWFGKYFGNWFGALEEATPTPPGEVDTGWSLAGVYIPAPHKKNIRLDLQSYLAKSIDGGNHEELIGDEKKVISVFYESIEKSDYDYLISIRQTFVDSGTQSELIINKDGFSFTGNVIIEIPDYELYISNHYDYRKLRVTFIEQ